jgi:hypothetical protein
MYNRADRRQPQKCMIISHIFIGLYKEIIDGVCGHGYQKFGLWIYCHSFSLIIDLT